MKGRYYLDKQNSSYQDGNQDMSLTKNRPRLKAGVIITPWQGEITMTNQCECNKSEGNFSGKPLDEIFNKKSPRGDISDKSDLGTIVPTLPEQKLPIGNPPPLKVAGALGGSIIIYSDIESHHLSSADALALANEIKLMAEKVVIESTSQ